MITKRKNESAMQFLERLYGPMTFARLMLSLRQCDAMSQKEFANLLGVSKQFLCDIEKGRKTVSIAKAAHFAESLGYPPSHFVRLVLQEEIDRNNIKLKILIEAA